MHRFRSIRPHNNDFLNALNSDRENDNLKGTVKYVMWVEAESEKRNPLSYLGSHFAKPYLQSLCQYNISGQKTDYRQTTEDNYLHELIESDYNFKNQLEKIVVFDEEGNINFSVNYKYNSKGQIIEEYYDIYKELFRAYYDTRGLVKKIVCESEVDEYRNATYIIHRDSKKPNNITEVVKNEHLKTKFNYDKNGNAIKIQSYKGLGGKELYSTEEITYDSCQNIVKRVVKDNRRTRITEFDYIYDDQNNWINSSFYSDGELLSRTTREIGYY